MIMDKKNIRAELRKVAKCYTMVEDELSEATSPLLIYIHDENTVLELIADDLLEGFRELFSKKRQRLDVILPIQKIISKTSDLLELSETTAKAAQRNGKEIYKTLQKTARLYKFALDRAIEIRYEIVGEIIKRASNTSTLRITATEDSGNSSSSSDSKEEEEEDEETEDEDITTESSQSTDDTGETIVL